MDRKHRVFITYSRQDIEITDRILKALEMRGIEVLIDRHSIMAGEDWRRRLGQLIADADTILFMLTPHSVESPICAWEAEEAHRLEKRILPVVLHDISDRQVPHQLARLNYLFLTEPNDYSAFETLVRAVLAGAEHGAVGRDDKIFISYRRATTEHVAGRIYDHLEREFGEGQVFFDVEHVPLGIDFREYIRDAVLNSKVMLAVVGNGWIGSRNRGVLSIFTREEDDEDYVKTEIELAIEHSLRTIPLLVDGASMPRRKDLPTEISQFSKFNGKSIRAGTDFRKDMADIIAAIKRI